MQPFGSSAETGIQRAMVNAGSISVASPTMVLRSVASPRSASVASTMDLAAEGISTSAPMAAEPVEPQPPCNAWAGWKRSSVFSLLPLGGRPASPVGGRPAGEGWAYTASAAELDPLPAAAAG